VGKLTPVVSGKFVAFDSSPLIYYIEQHPEYAPVAEDLFGAVDRGDSLAMTSVLTLLEVLVRPFLCRLCGLSETGPQA